MSEKKEIEETIKGLLEHFSKQIDSYDFYNRFLFNAEEVMEMVFSNYIEQVEGRCCSVDKAGYIVSKIKKALQERKNIKLNLTYEEYRDNGGDLGGINESNTDLTKICYWCPKTIKDTDTAINLYLTLLNFKSKSIKNHQTQKAIECLKEVVKKLYDEFESGTFITDEGKEYYGSYVKYCLILDFVIDKLKALGLECDDIFVDNILKELEEGK